VKLQTTPDYLTGLPSAVDANGLTTSVNMARISSVGSSSALTKAQNVTNSTRYEQTVTYRPTSVQETTKDVTSVTKSRVVTNLTTTKNDLHGVTAEVMENSSTDSNGMVTHVGSENFLTTA